jgi:AcrR family transcriptional regulator
MDGKMARRKGRRLTREDVIEAGLSCLRQEGVSGLGVNRVARELGIKPPSLYNHVEGNDDLKRAVAIRGWSSLADRLEAALEDSEGRDRLWSVSRAYRDFVTEQPALYAVMSTMGDDGETDEYGEVRARVSQCLEAVLDPFDFSADEAGQALRALRAALHGFVSLESTGHLGDHEKAESSYDWLVSRLVGQ